MSHSSLLNIDPDKLFEQASIPEIEDVQKKLQNEIERKREELRTMVGERYRDLIEAADTISEMKKLSEKVINDVNKMKISTAELQRRHVTGFKIDYSNKNVQNNSWASVAVQIKILVDMGEYIWEAVDQSNFTQAALLFLMARFIKTGLEINPSIKTAKYFPVVSRHWSSLAHFKETILRGAEEMLKTQLNSQVHCGGLVSLALLESSSAPQLLERYLSLRSDALRTTLSSTLPLDSASIKHCLCHSYLLLIHTMVTIFHCFFEHVQAREGLVWKELNSHIGPQSPPTLQLLNTEAADIPVALLPAAVKEFRPTMDRPLDPELLPSEQVIEAVTHWMDWVKAHVKEQGGLLLQKLSSLRSLQGLREPPADICEEWPLVAQKLKLGPNTDLWNELYRSLITIRAQQLVSVHWDAAFKALQQQVQCAFQGAAMEKKETEVDLPWYMWKESKTDLNNLNDVKSNRGLWLKSKGVTPRVAELCAALEHKVSSLLGDLTSLCPDQEVDPTLLSISHTLKAHQQTVCANLVTRLVQFVGEVVSGADSEAGVMLLAKFLQAVPELCPSLGRCLSSLDNKAVSWQDSQAALQVQCMAVYKKWLSLASGRVLQRVTDCLGSVVPHLHSIPQWEDIPIEEEGEGGEKIQSTLKVPCSSTLSLQSALHNLASAVGHVAVPKQISDQLVETVLASVIEIYRRHIDDNLTQTQYLQMLLDIKYLSYLFNSNNNEDLKNKFKDAISVLESKIDPFDLNVFMPYINENVKTTAQKTQALLGVTGPGLSVVVAGGGGGASHRTEEPSILALSSTATTWFPLLHITAPRTSQPSVKSKIKKTNSPATNSPSETGSKPSSASSFFGAMATEWFG